MIGENEAAANIFLDNYIKLSGIDTLNSEKQIEFNELVISVLSPQFPGGILSWPSFKTTTVYYGIADTPDQWRKLRPLLLAFAGPTLTSFSGCPSSFEPSFPLEEFLFSKNFYVIVRFIPGRDDLHPRYVRRSLVRMINSVINAPKITNALPEPTSRLISKFVDFLNGNNIKGAESILNTLRHELRLDALNLSFLRIQMLAHFCSWRDIIEMPEFASLCYTRKPPSVTVALLEALYQIEMSTLEDDHWFDNQRNCWKNKVREFARPLLRLPIPIFCKVGALTLYAWEALDSENRNQELEQAILVYEDSIGELATVLRSIGRDGFSEIETKDKDVAKEDRLNLADVQNAIVDAEGIDTLYTINRALSQIQSLSNEDKDNLLNSELFRSMIQSINAETNGFLLPEGWINWLNCLNNLAFKSSHIVLQHAVNEWPASDIIDPSDINEFANKLYSLNDNSLAQERLIDALPHLTSWIVNDPDFPRASMTPIYESLFFYIVVSVHRNTNIYNSATILIRALLTNGLTIQQYNALLNDCIDLLGEGVGTRNVDWLLDIVEETILNSTPSIESRNNFWFKVWELLRPIKSYLGTVQYLSISKIASTQGWVVDLIDRIESPIYNNEIVNLRSALANKSIAIYSLTESAAKQARNVLNEISPDTIVQLSHDKVGTDTLKNMALNSDIFVIATASAKHAATGFIQKLRPREKPLLFSAGRGFSSILRAIEDHVLIP